MSEGNSRGQTEAQNANTFGPDMEAQRAARDAIMQIGLFPELNIELKKKLRYGPHVDMLQHFVYWFHPRHKTMRDRWTLYKTASEWYDECGLSRRQVIKGRKVLRERGLVAENKGPHAFIHYTPDWVAIARTLNHEFRLHGNSVQPDNADDPFGDENGESDHTVIPCEDRLHGNSVQGRLHGNSVQARSHGNSVLPITEDYAGDYSQESSVFQTGAEPASRNPRPNEIDQEKEQDSASTALPVLDKRHSQDGLTPARTTAKRNGTPPKPDDDALLSDVRQILDPDSGRWWAARTVAAKIESYTPETLTRHLIVDDEIPERLCEMDQDALLPFVRYVLWERKRAA